MGVPVKSPSDSPIFPKTRKSFSGKAVALLRQPPSGIRKNYGLCLSQDNIAACGLFCHRLSCALLFSYFRETGAFHLKKTKREAATQRRPAQRDRKKLRFFREMTGRMV